MTALVSGAAGTIALLELDSAAVGPFLFSRPFVVGPLVGWLLGDVWAGAVLGAAFEALTLAETPLGGRLDFSAPVAAGVAAALAAGPARIPGEAAFLAGVGAGWLHARVEKALRRGRGGRCRRVESALAAGKEPNLGSEVGAALCSQAAATFAVSAVFLFAAEPALAKFWPLVPAAARAGARMAYACAPWIGAGGLAASLLRRA